MDTKVKELISASISKIHELADAETVIGEPIVIDGNITIIPVSKVSYGFAAGGSDLPSKNNPELFGGASGAGVTIQPLAFIVVNDGNVQLLQMNLDPSTSTAIINMVPEVFNKVQSLFKKDKCETKKVSKKSKTEEVVAEKDDLGEFDF
jgi:sporulation protein YtfJ